MESPSVPQATEPTTFFAKSRVPPLSASVAASRETGLFICNTAISGVSIPVVSKCLHAFLLFVQTGMQTMATLTAEDGANKQQPANRMWRLLCA